MSKIIQEKIDNVLSDLSQKGYDFIDKLNIVSGEYVKILPEILKKKAYYGKVAIFGLEQTFLCLAGDLKKILRESKNISIDYILNGKEEISLDTVSKIFNLPDDIRAIIVLDAKISNIADYFAKIKKVPVVDLSCGLDVGEYLENTFYLKNDKDFDIITTDSKKTIIIDETLSEKLSVPKSYAFDYIMKNIVSLLDIRINAFYTDKKLNVTLINLKSKIIIETFSIMKTFEKDRFSKLVLNCLTVGCINRILNQEYFLCDSVHNLSLLYYGFTLNREKELLFASKIISLYGILVNCETEIYQINDFNSISKTISDLLQVNEEKFIENIIKVFSCLTKKEKKFTDFLDKFREEIYNLSTSFNKVLSTHTVLGGKDLDKDLDKERFNNSVKCCGALNNICGMTLFVNNGLINLI